MSDEAARKSRQTSKLILDRVFDKNAANEDLKWWIESHPIEVPDGFRFFWVPVHGDKRGSAALKAIEAAGTPVGLIEALNRITAGDVLRKYEPMFWQEAWLVARQYGLPQRVVGDMTREAFARFVCHDLYNAGFVKALDMAPAYDPNSGVTLGMFVQARVRQAMHSYMRETVNSVRVPRGKQFTKEISRDAPGKEYLGADRNEHTEWEKFVSLLDADWTSAIARSISDAVARGDMPERWARILELRFLCDPDRRLTLQRVGELLGIKKSTVYDEQQRAIQAAGALLSPAVRRLRDIQHIFWEARNLWRQKGSRYSARSKLYEERIDQITLDERKPTAPQSVDSALSDRERSQEQPNPDDESYQQLKNRTGDPDWQPKAKARNERQRLGLLFPCSTAHLWGVAIQAVSSGYPVRCWHMTRWVWQTWKYHRQKPAVLTNRVAVYVQKSCPSDRKN
jgi:RNA polymerase sigma factor (sigma-70 family)